MNPESLSPGDVNNLSLWLAIAGSLVMFWDRHNGLIEDIEPMNASIMHSKMLNAAKTARTRLKMPCQPAPHDAQVTDFECLRLAVGQIPQSGDVIAIDPVWRDVAARGPEGVCGA